MENFVGFTWLAHECQIKPVQPFRTTSLIRPTKASYRDANFFTNHYLPSYRPEPTFPGHFEFALKYETINLEFLARLFARIGSQEVQAWVHNEPFGKYARKAGFLYEWLTGEELDFNGVKSGAYVNLLEDNCLQASKPRANPKWRVRDNLPGTPGFCPLVLRTDAVKAAEAYDVAGQWHQLEEDFGADLIARSAVWLTLKESRASFAIEGEANQADRIRRFAAAMERYTGEFEEPLAPDSIETLQRAILGKDATGYGLRQSPVFVGETSGALEIVHYVAPSWEAVPGMMEGLAETGRRTAGRSPLVRAAVLSFGFVYIHPLADGNGRISRFLVNDTLRRDGVLPAPFVLPISAAITKEAYGRRDYDRILERLSKPLMATYRDDYRFGKMTRYPDGLTSDLDFNAYDDADPVWRYPDLTDHVIYMHELVRATVEEEVRTEARQMRVYRNARRAVNEVIEGPDSILDRIVRGVHENNWTVSKNLKKNVPLLEDEEIAARIVLAVRAAFDEETP